MDKPTNTDVVLERLGNLIEKVDAIQKQQEAQNAALQQVPVLKLLLETKSDALDRAFSALKTVRETTAQHSTQLTAIKARAALVGSLSGFALTLALGVAGWTFKQFENLHATDNELILRLTALEVKNSVTADKFEQNGWVRK